MSAEPINEATDAELDAKMLRELRDYAGGMTRIGSRSRSLTPEELDLLLRIADERDALRRAFCEEPEAPNPYAATPDGVSTKYLVLSCHYCGHATHGAGFLCHDSKTCACRGGL